MSQTGFQGVVFLEGPLQKRQKRKQRPEIRTRSGHLEDSSKPLEVWAHSRVQPRSLLPPKPIPLSSRMEPFF